MGIFDDMPPDVAELVKSAAAAYNDAMEKREKVYNLIKAQVSEMEFTWNVPPDADEETKQRVEDVAEETALGRNPIFEIIARGLTDHLIQNELNKVH